MPVIQPNLTNIKGKRKAAVYEEGPGGTAGIVLPLQMISTAAYQTQYTVPLLVGSSQQNLSLQVDTGSSDLWIASTSCSTSPCDDTDKHLYNSAPSGVSTNQTFAIQYTAGQVTGPIVWDSVVLGDYNITSQALAAASSVSNEPLSPDFNGILGLALPLNSIIAEKIPPTYGDNPDGAIFASNLFSLSPATDAPAARFLSLALERPGSDRVPSVLGVGRHPSELVPDPSAIHYSTLVSGAHYWEAALNSIALYVDGERKEVQLTNSPTAILDSGTPIILASTAIANGIYGAIGVSPGADGQYYVPCKTPLNMTIQLDDRPEIPLHPLDLTYPPANDASASTCTGIIQTFASIGQSDGEVDTDMILGVPFLRNTYTVLAFEAPNIDGSFSPPPPSVDSVGVPATSDIDPHLGLMNLTDPTVAMQEFLQVRVYNQPLGSGSQSSQQSIPSPSSSTSSHHLPIGVDILLGLMGFLAFSFALFGARWLSGRNKPHNESPRILTDAKNQDAYTLEALARPLSMQTDITTAYSHSSQGDTLRTPHSKIASASKEYGYFAVDDGSASSHELGSLDRSLSRKTSSHCIRPSSSPLRLSATSKETLVTLCAPSPTLPHTQLSSHHHTLSGEATAAVPLLLSPSPQAAFSPLHPHDSDLAPHTGYDTEGHGEEEFSMAGVGSSRSRSSRFRTADHDVN